jgi:signal peptidase II
MQRYAYLIIVLPIFLLDRWTKLLIVDHLSFLECRPVYSWLSIVHWRNTGGLFGFMAQHNAGRYVFLVLPLLIIAGLVYYLVAYRHATWSRVALTLVLSGALGNIYDRIAYGYVIDFIDVSYKNHHWPAFNVADSAITVGICLWLLAEFLLKEQTPPG